VQHAAQTRFQRSKQGGAVQALEARVRDHEQTTRRHGLGGELAQARQQAGPDPDVVGPVAQADSHALLAAHEVLASGALKVREAALAGSAASRCRHVVSRCRC
jgi:hypothetical protein